MDDQIHYEQRRYDNLRSAIMKEDEQERLYFKPLLNKKSMQIATSNKNLRTLTSSPSRYIDRNVQEY
jgi:hypothetical protein